MGITQAVKESLACPKCHAPVGAPCADLRSYDRNVYGNRIHAERRQAYDRTASTTSTVP